MPIRIGVQVQPQHADYDGMRRAWREAEELGVDIVYTWDHFFPLYGDPDGKHFECVATLGSMAEVTERVEIGTLVVCNSYRNPELLAHAHMTVDHASGGRVVLGIGAGWFQKDYAEYGYEFGDAPYRLRELRKALPRIERRLAALNPPPLREIPIMIGGGGEKVTLKLVAMHADRWHSFGDPDTFRHKQRVLRGHCETVGRKFEDIMLTVGARTKELAKVEALAEAGAHEYVVGISGDGSGYDLSFVRAVCRWRDANS